MSAAFCWLLGVVVGVIAVGALRYTCMVWAAYGIYFLQELLLDVIRWLDSDLESISEMRFEDLQSEW